MPRKAASAAAQLIILRRKGSGTPKAAVSYDKPVKTAQATPRVKKG